MIHRTPSTDAHWEKFKEAYVRYVVYGVIPGHFLQAVLANDLFDAHCRADNTSAGILTALVRLIHNEFPSQCHGSRKAIKEWGDVAHEDVRADVEFNIQSAILTNYDNEG